MSTTPILMDANAYNATTKMFTSGGVQYYILGAIDQTVASSCTPCVGTWSVTSDNCEGSSCAGLFRTIKCNGPGNCPANTTLGYPSGIAGTTTTVPCGTVKCLRATLANTFTGCFDGTTSVTCGGNRFRQYALSGLGPSPTSQL
jgi:hypothetical protein